MLYVGSASQLEEWRAWEPGKGDDGDLLDREAYVAGARPPRPFSEYEAVACWYEGTSREDDYRRALYVKGILSYECPGRTGEWLGIGRFPPAEERVVAAVHEEIAEATRTAPKKRAEADVARAARSHYAWIVGREAAEAQRAKELAEERREDWDQLYVDESELAKMTVPPALIDGVLPTGVNAILRGRDGTYKSFVALDWALHLALGRVWDGHVTDAGPVLYIAGEGAYGMKDRVAAWRAFHKVKDPLPFTLRRSALNLYAPGDALEHLLGWVEGHKIRLVVIDTLRRVSGGADENGSGMGQVIDSIERIKAAMSEVGGSTLTVAHTGKSDTDSRGFSGIEDDIDTVWHCKREESTPFVTLLNTKQKDGPELTPVTLKAEPCEPSLVLTGAMGAGAVSAEVRIISFLTYETDERVEGETASVIERKTALPRRTVFDALDRMVDRGDLIVTRTTRPKKYAAASTLARFIGGST